MLGVDTSPNDRGEHPNLVQFDGITYRLLSKGRYYLSQSTTNEGRKGAKGLHVAIWEKYSGQKVPPGWEVHHKDGNPFNNEFSNLDCLSRSEHSKTINRKTERVRRNLDRIRPLASAWHRSEAGRAWHREHAKQPKSKQECNCLCCGKPFLAKRADAKYCSRKCEVKYRYDNDARPEERACVVCGANFTALVGPYRKRTAVTCSRKCRGIWRVRKQVASLQSDD